MALDAWRYKRKPMRWLPGRMDRITQDQGYFGWLEMYDWSFFHALFDIGPLLFPHKVDLSSWGGSAAIAGHCLCWLWTIPVHHLPLISLCMPTLSTLKSRLASWLDVLRTVAHLLGLWDVSLALQTRITGTVPHNWTLGQHLLPMYWPSS